jgi:sugar phosphate isomerase/epimerase
MNYAVATDYTQDSGNPEKTLRNISEAGFTHVHWCNQWCTDFLYSNSEIENIKKCMKEFGLKLLDTHGSAGREKCWFSVLEYQREAGVELVKNRIEMTSELGGDAVVMHIPSGINNQNPPVAMLNSLRRSLDDLEPYALNRNIRIAIEHMPVDNFKSIKKLFEEYSQDFLGFCYDTGHGNMGKGNGFKFLEELKERLICIHMHDNDGTGDQHMIPTKGTIEWPVFMKLLKASSYNKALNAEVFNHDEIDDQEFLKEALLSLQKLDKV